jgi:hypothetical protein
MHPDRFAQTPEQLVRLMRRMKRTLEQLESEFARNTLDVELLLDLDRMVDEGLSAEPRTAHITAQLERLRENTLTPRPELYTDGIRDCRRLKALLEEVMGELG